MHHASDCNTAQPGRPRQPTTARLLPLSSQQPPGLNVIGETRIVSLKEKMRLFDFPSCRASSPEDSPPEGSQAEEARADPHPISKPDQVTETFQPGAPSSMSAEDILAEMMGDLPPKRRPHTPASAAGANPRSRVHTGRCLAQFCTASHLVKGVC